MRPAECHQCSPHFRFFFLPTYRRWLLPFLCYSCYHHLFDVCLELSVKCIMLCNNGPLCLMQIQHYMKEQKNNGAFTFLHLCVFPLIIHHSCNDSAVKSRRGCLERQKGKMNWHKSVVQLLHIWPLCFYDGMKEGETSIGNRSVLRSMSSCFHGFNFQLRTRSFCHQSLLFNENQFSFRGGDLYSILKLIMPLAISSSVFFTLLFPEMKYK